MTFFSGKNKSEEERVRENEKKKERKNVIENERQNEKRNRETI